MRILPHSIKQIEEAIEKAKNGGGLSPSKLGKFNCYVKMAAKLRNKVIKSSRNFK